MIYMNENDSKRKIKRFMEIVEHRHTQRKKKTTLIILGNIIWLSIIVYYVIFGIPFEIYLSIFVIWLIMILLIGKFFRIDPIPDWDDL